jgi:hypothetical protein
MERPSPRRATVPVCKEIPPRVAEYTNQKSLVFVPYTFAPISNIDGYIRDRGLTGEEEALYRRLYTPPPEPEPVAREVPPVPSDPLHAFVKMSVVFNLKTLETRVKVKITVPWEPVYLAQQKGTLPPLAVRIKAAHGFGYPESTLLQMMKNHEQRKERIKKMDECIESVFGKCMSAKTNKPKKKTVQEALNSKFKKKPAKKYS